MDYKNRVGEYLDKLEADGVSEHNAKLIRDFIRNSKARTSQPCNHTLYDLAGRMKTITRLLKNKPLDKLTEENLKDLNLNMQEKGFKYPSDYRRVIKAFFRLKDRRKYIDLIESEFLSERGRKHDKILVDPDTFFSKEECEAYLKESIRTLQDNSALQRCGLLLVCDLANI